MPEDTIKDEEYAPITQELRDYIERHPTMMNAVGLTDLCDNIDALHKSLERKNAGMRDFCERVEQAAQAREDVTLWGVDYMPLPLDADGVPINVGDMLAEDGASPVKVESLMLDFDGWSVNFGLGWCCVKYHKWHHVKPDTWERIIEDAVKLGFTDPDNEHLADKLVARCKALCERTREGE